MKEITKDNFDEFVTQEGISVLDFYADWCGPCKRMVPLLNKVELEYKNEKVQFGKVDIDNEKELVDRFKVVGVPTFMFFKEGWNVGEFTGVRPINLLRQDIDNLLSGDKNGHEEKGNGEEALVKEEGFTEERIS